MSVLKTRGLIWRCHLQQNLCIHYVITKCKWQHLQTVQYLGCSSLKKDWENVKRRDKTQWLLSFYDKTIVYTEDIISDCKSPISVERMTLNSFWTPLKIPTPFSSVAKYKVNRKTVIANNWKYVIKSIVCFHRQ